MNRCTKKDKQALAQPLGGSWLHRPFTLTPEAGSVGVPVCGGQGPLDVAQPRHPRQAAQHQQPLALQHLTPPHSGPPREALSQLLQSSCAALNLHCSPSGALPAVTGKWQKQENKDQPSSICPNHIYAFPMRHSVGQGLPTALSPSQISLSLYCPTNIELFCAKSSCFLQKHWIFLNNPFLSVAPPQIMEKNGDTGLALTKESR